MTKKRRRRKPEQIVRAIQEGETMLAAGKSEAEACRNLLPQRALRRDF